MTSEPNRVGDYEILNSLGAGGMGQVYRVRNVISDRIEAMKILLPSLSEHRDVGERFLREIKLVASLHHTNIANLCTAMAVNNQLVMVMEYVDGQSFADLLSHGPIPMGAALNCFDQALAALGYAHSKGIVHRDLKPSNIMVTRDGVVKLMDFGIARSSADRALTQTGATIGTVSYMSPEQIAGKVTDARSDLYSMGIFFYETVTGIQPFKGDSDYELMVAHMQQTPRRPIEIVPGLPVGLNEIIMRLLAKTPEERFQTAEDVRTALHAVDGFHHSPSAFDLPARPAGTAKPPVQRQATVVENFAMPARATTLEPALSGLLVRDSPPERRMTEVASVPTYEPPGSAALASGKKGFARHPALYVGGGLAFTASAIALPLLYVHRDKPEKKEPAVVAPAQPIAPPVATPAKRMEAAPVKPSISKPPPVVAPVHGSDVSGKIAVAAVVTTPASAPGPSKPADPVISSELKARLDEEELQIDQLESRSASINRSLNTMSESMHRDGVSMRGDIASKQVSMNINLNKAKQALGVHDADRAGKFAAMAETEAHDLESFLGR